MCNILLYTTTTIPNIKSNIMLANVLHGDHTFAVLQMHVLGRCTVRGQAQWSYRL